MILILIPSPHRKMKRYYPKIVHCEELNVSITSSNRIIALSKEDANFAMLQELPYKWAVEIFSAAHGSSRSVRGRARD
jgi:hypothetical protein